MVRPGQPNIETSAELATYLRDLIVDGGLRPGALLPSERDLMQTYDIGREAVRRAVRALRAEGLLELDRGEGWRVREPVAKSTVRIQRGSRMSWRMPTPEERRKYDIPEGVPVLVVEHGGKPPQVLPGDRFDGTTA